MENNRSNGDLHRLLATHKNSFNPALQSLSTSDLLTNVQDFYDKKKLGDVIDLNLLKRGALLAQDPDNLEQPEERNAIVAVRADQSANEVLLPRRDKFLTELEAQALKRETRGEIGSLTKGLVVTLATCAVGAIVQGWSQQSIVGANWNWPIDLHIATRSPDGRLQFNQPHPNGLRFFGIVNAIPYFAASVLGAWVSDPLTHRYGRRTALFFAGLCSLAAPIGGAYCQTWYQLMVCRIIQGVGMGAKSSVVPILESEVCPPKMRGKLLVSWQTFVAVGIFLGATANLIFAGHWRLQLGISFVPALPLLFLCYVIRESPRWLIKDGQYGNAYLALMDLRETPLQAARDLYRIHAQLKLEESLFSRDPPDHAGYMAILKQPETNGSPRYPGFFRRFCQLFTIRRNLRALVGSCIVMVAQQCSGINIYAFLSTTLFNDSNFEYMKAQWFTFGFALSNAIFSASAYFLIDRLGRRTLIISSMILMIPFLISTGYLLDTRKDGSPPLVAVITLVILYTAVYSPGAGVIPFMYASEVFPLVYREAGMSSAVSVNLGLAGVLAMVVSLTVNSGNMQSLLGAFAGLDGLATVGVWLFMRSPEEAMSLEEMNYLFLQPSIWHIRYQAAVALPWAIMLPFRFLRQTLEPKPSFDKWYNDMTQQGAPDQMGHSGIELWETQVRGLAFEK